MSPSSFLKALREKKNLSQAEIAKRLQLTRYQIQSLEGHSSLKILERFFLYAHALGYKTEDIADLMAVICGKNEFRIERGMIEQPVSESIIGEGVKIVTYQKAGKGNFFIQLFLGVGRGLGKGHFPAQGTLFGIVREGTLVIDQLTKEEIFKKDHFFFLPSSISFELWNRNNCPASILLISTK